MSGDTAWPPRGDHEDDPAAVSVGTVFPAVESNKATKPQVPPTLSGCQ